MFFTTCGSRKPLTLGSLENPRAAKAHILLGCHIQTYYMSSGLNGHRPASAKTTYMKFDLNNSSMSFGTIMMGSATLLVDGMRGCSSLHCAAPTYTHTPTICTCARSREERLRVSPRAICAHPELRPVRSHIHSLICSAPPADRERFASVLSTVHTIIVCAELRTFFESTLHTDWLKRHPKISRAQNHASLVT
ncbi:hypothetical protein BDN71DRAFT_1445147 [Pleurotus eryngii]|uniref:Uncharacterized protein n=1 Tax=Pleurotus eryngii TaxID=5323 RepID=A0A9P6DHZ7_PLEER|nr:hypothetical protein BDN71DRAFT_1445147 [Pleurotus eryngii]